MGAWQVNLPIVKLSKYRLACRYINKKGHPMCALPVYEVEFIPLERRLSDRRLVARDSAPAPKVSVERRKTVGRRAEDRKTARLKLI
jgi:hypothetical protein